MERTTNVPEHRSKAGRKLPRWVAVTFALVLTPVGTGLAIISGYEAWVDATKVEVQGMVIEARVSQPERRPSKVRGSWLKEWLAEYRTADGTSRQWFHVGWQRSHDDAAPIRDVGKSVPVWYSPGAVEEATIVPPEVLRKVLWAGWSTVLAAAGFISIYALIWRRSRLGT